MTGIKYEHPKDNERLNVYFYIIKCAFPSERASGNYSPGDTPWICYDRTLSSIGSAKARQREIMERNGLQSFWTVGVPYEEAYA